jgi:hypothetical protein
LRPSGENRARRAPGRSNSTGFGFAFASAGVSHTNTFSAEYATTRAPSGDTCGWCQVAGGPGTRSTSGSPGPLSAGCHRLTPTSGLTVTTVPSFSTPNPVIGARVRSVPSRISAPGRERVAVPVEPHRRVGRRGGGRAQEQEREGGRSHGSLPEEPREEGARGRRDVPLVRGQPVVAVLQ